MMRFFSTVENTGSELFQTGAGQGTCRVVCFHPSSTVTLAKMTLEEIKVVIDVWVDQMIELREKYTWVQV